MKDRSLRHLKNVGYEFFNIMASGSDRLSELEELNDEIKSHKILYNNQRSCDMDAEDWDVEIRYQQRKLQGLEEE